MQRRLSDFFKRGPRLRGDDCLQPGEFERPRGEHLVLLEEAAAPALPRELEHVAAEGSAAPQLPVRTPLEGMVAQLGLERFTLIGTSMGGIIAMAYAGHSSNVSVTGASRAAISCAKPSVLIFFLP